MNFEARAIRGSGGYQYALESTDISPVICSIVLKARCKLLLVAIFELK